LHPEAFGPHPEPDILGTVIHKIDIAAGSKIATDEWIATLQRRIIGIIGTIELHQGKPEIEVMSEDQIKGLDSPAQ
jgi:hypothetical protein